MKLLTILTLVATLSACHSNGQQDAAVQKNNLVASAVPKPPDTLRLNSDTISINAVGDIMFGSNFPDLSEMPPDLGKDLLKPFESYLKKADVVFGNAEGVFLDTGGTPKGTGGNVFCFRQPTNMAQYFLNYGFNLISVANNHVADFGEIGLNSTDEVLRKLPIAFAGSTKQPTCIITVKGKKIGMAAFAPHKGSVDMNDLPNAINIVKKLKQQCDIVIVSFHGGGEGEKQQRVTKKREIFFGQNRGNVYQFAHSMIDAGADVLIGHGPHVVRAVELYKNKFIAYSLGNFCTYGMFNLKNENSNAPLLKLNVNSTGDFVNAQIISGKQYGEGGPILDEENKEAFKTIEKLTKMDFPTGSLDFADGWIRKR
jgi:poly-gamma-glutamate capsule biosynthesis protein CapA/YwtB (metallophosphatase superfamily)